MSTCKDCLHYEACKGTYYTAKGDKDILYEFESEMYAHSGCEYFKPKADYAPVKHGKWVKDRNKRTCSICGFLYLENGKTTFNFCPNCGTNMKGGIV